MTSRPILASACLLLAAASLPAQGDELLTVAVSDGLLRAVEIASGVTLRSVQIVASSGRNAVQCNGMSRHPVTGQLFILVREVGPATTRSLAILDPVTGLAALIGPTADSFAGIAFHPNGTLYGVTGDGATTPETLYTIDISNAQSTLVRGLGNGTDGETIAFHPDGTLYHASGIGTPNSSEIFERINIGTLTITPIPLSAFDYDEALSLTHLVGGNMLLTDLNDDLCLITTGGTVTNIGAMDHSAKGMVVVPSPGNQAFFRVFGDACPGASGAIPLLVGSGRPSPGQAFGMHLRAAPANSFGGIIMGFGNAAIPLPSPVCRLQILPSAPGLTSFTTSTFGEWNITGTVPAGLAPGDLYWQVGVLDGAQILVSNPLQTHIR